MLIDFIINLGLAEMEPAVTKRVEKEAQQIKNTESNRTYNRQKKKGRLWSTSDKHEMKEIKSILYVSFLCSLCDPLISKIRISIFSFSLFSLDPMSSV